MKTRFSNLLAMLVVLILGAPLFATDYINQTTEKIDRDGIFGYQMVVDVDTAVGTGDAFWSKPIYIGANDGTYGWLTARCGENGTEDVNIFLEYANDDIVNGGFTTWVVESTDSDLDAVGTTEVQDSIGIVQGTASIKYGKYSWCRIKVVPGQALTALDATIEAHFRKASGLATQNVARVKSVSE